ncbi:MAG: hypothetical protein HC811_11320 [Flammeovirgaceae bacterium]|nr:hypothetical protein [Flammeovirgaceae bacterium]
MAVIPFSIPENNGVSRVKIEVFDFLGKKVATLIDEDLAPDFYTTQWIASDGDYSGGLYTYKMVVAGAAGIEAQSGKIILNK